MTSGKTYDDLQRFGHANLEASMKVFGDVAKGWQAIAAEMTDYTRRSLEQSTAAFEKLMSARSIEQALEIQASFAKRSYDDYMQQLAKVNGLYADLAKDAYKPMQQAFQNMR